MRCGERASFSWIAGRARFATRPASSRSSVCFPASIPDYLALVGDAADGYPGLPGWGAKSAAAILARFLRIEDIPDDWRSWGVNATRPAALGDTLRRERSRALLFRALATLRTDVHLFDSVDDLLWTGPTPSFAAIGARLDAAVVHGDPATPRQPRGPAR